MMLKNVKVELLKDVQVNNCGIIKLKSFNERNGRLYFVDEYFEVPNKRLCSGVHTAMELLPQIGQDLNKPGTIYTVKPVYIYNDDNDNILNVVSLEKAFKNEKEYFIYWKDLFKDFIEEICEYVRYDEVILIDFLKDLMEKHPDQIYYYSDGNQNEFSLEVLDLYQFIGELTTGMYYGNVLISNIRLIDKGSEKIIKGIPWIQINGELETEDEDIDYLFSAYLSSMTKENMTEYIVKAINKEINGF